MTSPSPSYRGYRFPPEIISHAVWLYHRFCLSFRDVEDLLAHQPARQRERQMRRFKSAVHAQRFLSVHGLAQNLFRVGRFDAPYRPLVAAARSSALPPLRVFCTDKLPSWHAYSYSTRPSSV